jgi:valyl-tRNA synthetase
VGGVTLFIPLPAECAEKERVRLIKEREQCIEQQNKLRAQLANNEFLAKAPPPVVGKLRLSLEQSEQQLAALMEKLRVYDA